MFDLRGWWRQKRAPLYCMFGGVRVTGDGLTEGCCARDLAVASLPISLADAEAPGAPVWDVTMAMQQEARGYVCRPVAAV